MRYLLIAFLCIPSPHASAQQKQPRAKGAPTDLLKKIDFLIEVVDRKEYDTAKEQLIELRSEVSRLTEKIRHPGSRRTNQRRPDEIPALVMGTVTRQTINQRIIVPVKINKPDLLANYDLRLLVVADGEPEVAWIQSRGALGENKGVVEMVAQLGPKKINKRERFQISLIAWPKSLQWKKDTIPVNVAQRIFKPVGTVWVTRVLDDE